MSMSTSMSLRRSRLLTQRSYLTVCVCSLFVVFASHVHAQRRWIEFGDEWRFFRGTTSPSADPRAWSELTFDDTGWEFGPSGFGYGDDDDSTVLNDMPGNYTTVYLRREFDVPDLDEVLGLRIAVDFDDGFVAYLNGVEVVRKNAGSPGADLPFDAVATESHEAGFPLEISIDDALDLLTPGRNILAVQGLNKSLSSSDFSLNLRLEGVTTVVCPTNLVCAADPVSGTTTLIWTGSSSTFTEFDVLRDGESLPGSPFPGDTISVVDAEPGDFMHDYVLIARSDDFECHPISCRSSLTFVDEATEWRFFRGVGAPSSPATDWRRPEFDDSQWEVGVSGFGYGDGDDMTLLDEMPGNYISVYLRTAWVVPDVTVLRGVLLQIDYDDGFIAYVNGNEVARAGMGEPGTEFGYDQPATWNHEAGAPEQFGIDLLWLQSGENLIAIEGHNVGPESSDFSLKPTLIANLCPSFTALQCGAVGRGDVRLDWSPVPFDEVSVKRNGTPLPGSPFRDTEGGIVDSAAKMRDVTYELAGSFRGEVCAGATCSITCCDREPGALGCRVSLVDGHTEALLTWTPPEGAVATTVLRNGTRLAMLDPQDTEYVDLPMDAQEVQPYPSYQVVFGFDDGGTCTICCNKLSLCPEGFSCDIVTNQGRPVVQFSWRNVVAPWESFTIRRNGVAIVTGLAGDAVSFEDDTVRRGETYNYTLLPVGSPDLGAFCTRKCSVFTGEPLEDPFVRGDGDGNGKLQVTDGIRVFGYLFAGWEAGSCPDTLDTDDGGTIELSDGILLLNVLFSGEGEIAPPGVACDVDPTTDELRVCSYEGCP